MAVRFFVGFAFGAAILLSGQFAHAQIAGQNPALPAAAIAAFQANPGQLLSQFPNGGPDLTKRIVDLVGSSKGTLPAVIALVKAANNDQRKSIADGLAQVAKAYAASDPGFANEIQQSVAKSGVPEFAKAYAEAAGDTGTAAAGGAGGGGGGSGGGPVAGPPMGGPNSGSVASGNSSSVNGGSGLVGVSGNGNASFNQVSAF